MSTPKPIDLTKLPPAKRAAAVERITSAMREREAQLRAIYSAIGLALWPDMAELAPTTSRAAYMRALRRHWRDALGMPLPSSEEHWVELAHFIEAPPPPEPVTVRWVHSRAIPALRGWLRRQQREDRDPHVTGLHRQILDAVHGLGATPDTPAKRDAIAQRLRMQPTSLTRPLSELTRGGHLRSRGGRGAAGYWLP